MHVLGRGRVVYTTGIYTVFGMSSVLGSKHELSAWVQTELEEDGLTLEK